MGIWGIVSFLQADCESNSWVEAPSLSAGSVDQEHEGASVGETSQSLVLGCRVLSSHVVEHEAKDEGADSLDNEDLVVHVESLSSVFVLTEEFLWEVCVSS